MSIKYLLNGRIASDIYHLRNLIDSWTEERKFPEIINDCNEIRKEDIVITTGYLGHSGKLIKQHDPKKILIIDNSIFPKRGVKNFRLLDGNLKSLSKEFISSYEEENYYQSCLTKIKKDFAKEITISEEYQKNIIVEFPWSKQILNLARYSNNNYVKTFEEKTNSLKNKNDEKVIKFYKSGAILFLTPNSYPIFRACKISRSRKMLFNSIKNSRYLICPNSSLSYLAFINKKDVLISKYNPFYNWVQQNKNYTNLNNNELIMSLSLYISKINFSLKEIFEYIDQKLVGK